MNTRKIAFILNFVFILFLAYLYSKLDNSIVMFIFLSTISLIIIMLFLNQQPHNGQYSRQSHGKLYQNHNNNAAILSNIGIILGVSIVISIISSVNLNHDLWDDTALKVQEADTAGTWTANYSKNNMNRTQYMHFCHLILYPLFASKNINCPPEVFSDARFSYLSNKLSDINYTDAGIIETQNIDLYINKYNPQQFIFNTEDENLYKMYLVTGTEWQNDKKIFLLYDENKGIWAFPESLLDQNILKNTGQNISAFVLYSNNYSINSIQYQYKSDICMDNALELNTEHNSTALKNFLFLSILFLAGLCFLLVFQKKLLTEIIILLAVPTGTVIELFLVFIYGISRIPINGMTLYSGMAIFSIIGILSLQRKKEKQIAPKSNSFSLIYLGIVIMAMLYFSIFPYYYLSPDSVENIFYGEFIAQNGGFANAFNDISSYSLFMPFINAGAALLGIKLLYSYIPFIVFNTIIIFICFLNKILTGNEKKCNYNYLTIFTGIILLVSAPMFRLSSIWILNNELIGLFLGISVLLIIYSIKTTNYLYAYVALPFFLVSSCARIEGPMFGAVVVIAMSYYLKEHLQVLKIYSTSLTFCTVILFITQLIYNGATQGNFWTIEKGISVLALVICMEIYILLYQILYNKFKFIYKNITIILPILLLIVGYMMGLLHKEMFLENLNAFFENIFNRGYYSGFWVIGIFVCINSFLVQSEEFAYLRGIILSYAFLIFDLMMLRTGIPLHPGAGDSSCRMFLHIMPVMAIFIILFLKAIFPFEKLALKKKE